MPAGRRARCTFGPRCRSTRRAERKRDHSDQGGWQRRGSIGLRGGQPVRTILSPPPSHRYRTQFSFFALVPPEWGPFESLRVSVSVSKRRNGGIYAPVSASKISVPDSDVRDRFDDWVGSGSSVPSVSTIKSPRTADFEADSKRAVSVGIFAGIVPLFRSPVTFAVFHTDFSLPSLHPKIPFPAAGFSTARSRSPAGNFGGLGGQNDVSNPVSNYCGFNPRASNCRLHSAGASRNRSTPMPRGNRPSTAALTRSGARKASEIGRASCGERVYHPV